MARIGLLLAGNGLLDGSDPTQVVTLHVEIARGGDVPIGVAPSHAIRAGVDPIHGRPEATERAALSDAARLLRADCRSLDDVGPDHFDSLIVPGGLGAVKTLDVVAIEGVDAAMPEAVRALLAGLHEQGKVLAALDEGVLTVARALPHMGARFADPGAGPLHEDLRALGHEVVDAKLTEPVRDAKLRVISAHSDRGVEPLSAAAAATKLLASLREF